jgi:hypothetical protein
MLLTEMKACETLEPPDKAELIQKLATLKREVFKIYSVFFHARICGLAIVIFYVLTPNLQGLHHPFGKIYSLHHLP